MYLSLCVRVCMYMRLITLRRYNCLSSLCAYNKTRIVFKYSYIMCRHAQIYTHRHTYIHTHRYYYLLDILQLHVCMCIYVCVCVCMCAHLDKDRTLPAALPNPSHVKDTRQKMVLPDPTHQRQQKKDTKATHHLR